MPQSENTSRGGGAVKLECKACDGVMVKSSVSSGNAAGIVLALVVFAVGVVLCFTIIGALIGVPLCILSLFMGGKRQSVWKCRKCKAIIQRA